MSGGGRCRLGESALKIESVVEEGEAELERAHLRIGMSGGERFRLGESALESGREWCGGERRRLGESALDNGMK